MNQRNIRFIREDYLSTDDKRPATERSLFALKFHANKNKKGKEKYAI